jgi:hypothetical protein
MEAPARTLAGRTGALVAAILDGVADPGAAVPDGLLVQPGRLAIHRRHTRVSLTTALARSYPATEALVGEAFFAAAAARFIAAEPPRDPVVALYGAAFPDFLGRLDACAGLPWLADVARLEWLIARASLALPPAPVDPATLPNEPAAIARLRLRWNDVVALLASPWAVGEIVAAIRLCAGMPERLDLDTLPPARLCVLPGAAGPRVIDLSPAEFAFRAAIRGGETLAAAAARAGPSLDPGEALAALLADGAVSGPADDP